MCSLEDARIIGLHDVQKNLTLLLRLVIYLSLNKLPRWSVSQH